MEGGSPSAVKLDRICQLTARDLRQTLASEAKGQGHVHLLSGRKARARWWAPEAEACGAARAGQGWLTMPIAAIITIKSLSQLILADLHRKLENGLGARSITRLAHPPELVLGQGVMVN
jgi:hypothetical protein